MLNQHTSRCLFGGALFAAGIACQDANAGGFAHDQTTRVIAADLVNPLGIDPSYTVVSDAVFGDPPLSLSYADLDASVSVTHRHIRLEHTRSASDPFSYSVAGLLAYTYVIDDTPVTISWDFSAWTIGYLVIGNITAGETVLNTDFMGVSGQITLTLPGDSYYLFSTATGGSIPGGASAVSVDATEFCTADLDRNGILNVDDIDAFVAAFLGGC